MRAAWYPLIIAVLTVFLTIRAGLRHDTKQTYVFKPLSTVLIILAALLSLLQPERNLVYTIGVMIGLVLSLGGDVALMLPQRKAFMIGLVLFLLAHIAYMVTFTVLSGFVQADLASAAVLVMVGVAMYLFLRPGLGSMRVPVIAYIAVISLMVNRAISTFYGATFSATQALMISIGAVLFYLSDAVLAANRFWKPLKHERLGLALYYGGQALIALAASYFGS